MNNTNSNYLHSDITAKCLEAFYKVYNKLGHGFLEKIYVNALSIELKKAGLSIQREYPIDVYYEGDKIGVYYSDIMINEKVIIEVKAVDVLIPAHEAQLINYLRATDIEVGLLFNFGKKPESKRKVLTAPYKEHKKS